MKTKLLPVALLGLLFALSSCSKFEDIDRANDAPLTLLSVESDGTSMLTRANITPVLGVTPPLTADEIEFLYAMREDEKMSRDLYASFSGQHPSATQIDKIARAEDSHIACIEAVLDYYEIDYPAQGANGVFEDAERQERYNDLVGKAATLTDAFSTMALVEEETVFAYNSLQSQIENANISLVVANISRASSNHLRAAVRQLMALGGSYTPSFLTAEEFDAIVGSATQGGNACGQQKGQGGKGGNTNSQKGGQGNGNKGSVSGTGNCTGTDNGSATGQNKGGGVGKGYRGGRS